MIFLSTLSLRRATSSGIKKPLQGFNFYPRSPCGERHAGKGPAVKGYWNFYPRSPCGERRSRLYLTSFKGNYFYPRSPCGERRFQFWLLRFRFSISIHALLAESDAGLPVAGRIAHRISIHALLAESDLGRVGAGLHMSNFYPRSPCGERLLTLTVRNCSADISIHALLAESDLVRM